MSTQRLHGAQRPTGVDRGTERRTVPSMCRMIVWCCLVVIPLWVAGCGKPYEFAGTVYDPPQPAVDIVGTIQDGAPFQLSQLKDKVVVVFFGYTFCPDICPLTLADLKTVYGQLGERADDVAVVFVSVDPERDTSQRLAAYVGAFDPHFYGVHVPADALAQVEKGYYVVAEKEYPNGDTSSENYLMSHTSWIYLIDRQGNLRVLHSTESTPEEITADIRYLLDN